MAGAGGDPGAACAAAGGGAAGLPAGLLRARPRRGRGAPPPVGSALLEPLSSGAAAVPLQAVVGASVEPLSGGEGAITVALVLCEKPPPADHDPDPPPRPELFQLRLLGDLSTCQTWVAALQAALRANPARPRRCAVLVGRRSGTGKSEAAFEKARAIFRMAECVADEVPIEGSVRLTARRVAREHLSAIQVARRNPGAPRAGGWDALVVVGGDGILSEAAEGVLEIFEEAGVGSGGGGTLPLAVIPAGSTNAVSCGLMMPALLGQAPRLAAASVCLGHTRGLDVVRLETESGGVARSISFANMGFIADTAEKQDRLKWLGKAAQDIAGCLTCLQGRSYSARVHYQRGSGSAWEVVEGDFMVVGAALETRALNAPAGLVLGERVPGTTGLVLVRKTHRLNFLRFLIAVNRGRGGQAKQRHVQTVSGVTRFRVEAGSDRAAWKSDGDALGGAAGPRVVEGRLQAAAVPICCFDPELAAPDRLPAPLPPP